VTFQPTAAVTIELEDPLDDIDLSGESYGDARVLVRLHREPLGIVCVPVRQGSGRLRPETLMASVERELGAALGAHLDRFGCRADEPVCAGRQAASGPYPSVSVIVPTAARPERLRSCLASIMNLTYPGFEAIVVDNRPDDPSTREVVDELVARGHAVQYVSERFPGSAVARNRGIAFSRADIVAFTDDDVELDPEWLDWLVEPFRLDPEVGVTCGLVLAGDLLTPAQRRFEDGVGFYKGFQRRAYDLACNRADDRLLYPFWGGIFGSGNSMAFRRDRLAAIGGFDPALGTGTPALGGTDIEVFTHMILRGSRLVYEPRSVCRHDHRRDDSSLDRQLYSYGVGFTAILAKWAVRDPRLWTAGLRAARLMATRRHRVMATPVDHAQSARMNSIQRRGYLAGPYLYARSARWASRLGLRSVLPPSGA
jgi:glycosyltransferase involved in cell wall biosynthesis